MEFKLGVGSVLTVKEKTINKTLYSQQFGRFRIINLGTLRMMIIEKVT